jgi:hypothetical protein
MGCLPPQTDSGQPDQPGNQGGAGAWACWAHRVEALATSSATWMAYRPQQPLGLDQPAVRPHAELGRCGMDQEALGWQADPQGHQDVEDARLAVESGADALIVSNHGGRQLDGAESSINALPAIVDAVGKQIEVHMDGGIRSGQDVLGPWHWAPEASTLGAPTSMVWAPWGGRGHQSAGDHPQGNGHHHGFVWQNPH